MYGNTSYLLDLYLRKAHPIISFCHNLKHESLLAKPSIMLRVSLILFVFVCHFLLLYKICIIAISIFWWIHKQEAAHRVYETMSRTFRHYGTMLCCLRHMFWKSQLRKKNACPYCRKCSEHSCRQAFGFWKFGKCFANSSSKSRCPASETHGVFDSSCEVKHDE